MTVVGNRLTREELLKIDGQYWQCKCAVNIGEWESISIKEANNTAHWACENADIIAVCSTIINNRKYRVKIKKK